MQRGKLCRCDAEDSEGDLGNGQNRKRCAQIALHLQQRIGCSLEDLLAEADDSAPLLPPIFDRHTLQELVNLANAGCGKEQAKKYLTEAVLQRVGSARTLRVW